MVLAKYLTLLLVLLIPLRNIVEKIDNFVNIPYLGITNVLFLSIFALLVISGKPKDEIPSHNSKLRLPIILFIAYFFLTIFNTDPSIANFRHLFKYWKDLAFNMALFFIAARVFKTKKDILICLAVMAFANLYMDTYFWRWIRWMNVSTYADKIKYINGTFGNIGGANEWAAFFSTYTFILLALSNFFKKKVVRYSLYGLLVMNALVLIFTFSRGAYFAFLGGLVAYSLSAKRYIWLVMVVGILFAYSVILPTAVVERINMSFTKSDTGIGYKDSDVKSRLEMWNYSWNEIVKSPIFGHGFMSFRYGKWRNPHNENLYILYQGGIVGFVLFIWIFSSIILHSNFLRKRTKNELAKFFGIGLFSASISLIVANFFGDRWSYLPLTGYFWVLNGLATNIHRLDA